MSPLAPELDLERVLATYKREGLAYVGRLVDEATLAELRARTEALMRGDVAYPGLFFQLDSPTGRYEDLTYGRGWQGPSLDYRKIEKLELDPLFLAIIQSPAYEAIARAWIDGPIAIYRAALFNKSPRGGTPLPFHQDAGRFWGLDRDPTLQIWLGLDDAPLDGGCLEYVPGSHARGLATPLGGLVPEVLVESTRADERAVAVPTKAGDVVLVHNHVWHRTGANRTDHPRRGLTVCYMTAATRCLRKKRAPRQFPVVFP